MDNNIHQQKSNLKNLYNENVKPKNFLSKLKKSLIITFLSVFSSLLVGFILSFTYVLIQNYQKFNFNNQQDLESIVVTSTSDSSYNENSIKNIIKKTTPSIVSITTTTQTNNIFNSSGEVQGSGSGIIFHMTSENTYILTNNHVISGATQVGVAIDDSEIVYASLVGKDANSDIAVISVLNSDLKKAGISDVTVATFGNSDNMNEGDSVIAIGNALGEGKTATLGIISSTSKEIYVDGNYLSVLQTTAAINPGNSGGALINSKGEVIGINTAKVADTDVTGIGYSISSNVAMPVVEKIMNKSVSPALDIYISDVNTNQTEFGLGALVVDVIEGGSAYKSGIIAGDIITSLNDTPIFNSEQLVSELQNYNVGDTIKVNIIRNNETITIKVKLRETVNQSSGF